MIWQVRVVGRRSFVTTSPVQLPLRSILWVLFFAAILGAWAVMFMMARMSGVDVIGRPVGMNMMPMTSFGALFPMWAIMMAAMMLPTMIPTLRNYEALMKSADGTRAGWVGVLIGYFVTWIGFAALISVVQVLLIRFNAVDGLGISTTGWFASGLLIVVGIFQFTRAKEICHSVCHSPMTYFLGHWKTGFAGGLRMGLGLGAFCVGCCWGFMMLGFVGGVMSLLWMGLATLFMIFEKLPEIGHRITKPAGVVLIGAGVLLAVL